MVESMNPACSALAESYLLSLPVAARARHVSADYFCADAHNANLCAALVVAGRSEQPVASLTGIWRRASGCRNRGTYWW